MTQREPILEVRGVSIRYPLRGATSRWFSGHRYRFLDAVLDVSLTLQPGRTTALVGESGSGKSTLGRTIVGLQKPAAGQVLFDGRNPFAEHPTGDRAYRRAVSMMFQDPITSLSPRRRVDALIAEPFVVNGWNPREIPAEVRRLLALVGLHQDIAERYPHQLSGGQARRVGVARTIALNPKLIVADEPTAGLDVSVQAGVLNLLQSLQEQLGLSYLIITHNLALVRHVSDETAIMYMGRIVEQGPTAKIFARPAHPYTRALLEAQPLPDPDLRRQEAPLRGEIPSLLDRPTGCDFAGRCTQRQAICTNQAPPIEAVGPGRTCRCYFAFAGDAKPPISRSS
jgi:oligopeptide/dipeptide ABC transporter ATP-binding protein